MNMPVKNIPAYSFEMQNKTISKKTNQKTPLLGERVNNPIRPVNGTDLSSNSQSGSCIHISNCFKWVSNHKAKVIAASSFAGGFLFFALACSKDRDMHTYEGHDRNHMDTLAREGMLDAMTGLTLVSISGLIFLCDQLINPVQPQDIQN